MSRLPRPYIPISVRIIVAKRQLCAQGDWGKIAASIILPNRWLLKRLLFRLFGDHPFHLDHDPALVNRARTKSGKYIPDANDPDFLVYRTKVDHDIKTRVRGIGAQRSDLSQRRYNKRVERNRDPKRKRRRWPKRPFSKQRRSAS